MTRYPQIRVSLRSPNPFALVAAVREELRRAGVEKSEIELFSRQALASTDAGRIQEVCRQWIGAAATPGSEPGER